MLKTFDFCVILEPFQKIWPARANSGKNCKRADGIPSPLGPLSFSRIQWNFFDADWAKCLKAPALKFYRTTFRGSKKNMKNIRSQKIQTFLLWCFRWLIQPHWNIKYYCCKEQASLKYLLIPYWVLIYGNINKSNKMNRLFILSRFRIVA